MELEPTTLTPQGLGRRRRLARMATVSSKVHEAARMSRSTSVVEAEILDDHTIKVAEISQRAGDVAVEDLDKVLEFMNGLVSEATNG